MSDKYILVWEVSPSLLQRKVQELLDQGAMVHGPLVAGEGGLIQPVLMPCGEVQ